MNKQPINHLNSTSTHEEQQVKGVKTQSFLLSQLWGSSTKSFFKDLVNEEDFKKIAALKTLTKRISNQEGIAKEFVNTFMNFSKPLGMCQYWFTNILNGRNLGKNIFSLRNKGIIIL